MRHPNSLHQTTARFDRFAGPAGAGFVLDDGRPVDLAPLAVDHHDALLSFYERLCPRSRRARFLQAMPVVPPRLVRQMTDVDQTVHVAWAAWAGDRIVGEVRSVRLREEPDTAEIAFAVAEDARRVGLARRMIEALGVVARADGLRWFTSSVADDNHSSSTLLRSLGTSFRFQDGALQGRGPIPAWTGPVVQAERILHLQLVARLAVPAGAPPPPPVATAAEPAGWTDPHADCDTLTEAA